MTSPSPGRRPVIVTVAVVLLYASGLLNAAIGIVVLLSRYEAAADAVLTISLLGVAIILAGLLALAVAGATGRGSRLARALASVVIAALAALQVTAIATTEWDGAAIAQIVVQAFVLTALWVPPGSRFFARQAS